MLVPLEEFYDVMRIERPARVPGTAVFMTSNPSGTPLALLQNFTHNRVVHKRVILLTVTTMAQARVTPEDRLHLEELEDGFARVRIRCGFMEQPDVPALLAEHLPGFVPEHTTYFLGREALFSETDPGTSWRYKLFSAMSRNAAGATAFFSIPPDRVLELGTQIEVGVARASLPGP
jgi:KUP system potassium uptake protein